MTESKKIFKYNMSFYYQSTIIYFTAFVLYVVIRGEFVEDSFKLITKDPIIYFFAVIVLISVISLLYNLYKNKHLEINNEGISFISRFKSKMFKYSNILSINISRESRPSKRNPLRLIRIKLKNRKRPLVLRPTDYENADELLKVFQELKIQIESK